MPDPNWVREYQDDEVVPGTPYRVIRLIGAGGMGSVYEVEHIELGRRYVLKSLLSTLTDRRDLTARMRNEWRALGQIHHPNIVDIINAGTTSSGVPFYVMELLAGETVRERLEREVRIGMAEAVHIARGVLYGLEAAHSLGVVHRDVKPANVFLADDGAIKLLDFGIAKVHVEGAPKITIKGLAVGTPRYMSPEQAAGERADPRSDVYAVGLLLFEMITGQGPFHDAPDHAAQMDAHLHQIPPRLTDLLPVSDELAHVVARALEKDPDNRPQTARALADLLAPFGPASDPSRMPTWRPPPVMPVAAAVSGLLGGGFEGGGAAGGSPVVASPGVRTGKSIPPSPVMPIQMQQTEPFAPVSQRGAGSVGMVDAMPLPSVRDGEFDGRGGARSVVRSSGLGGAGAAVGPVSSKSRVRARGGQGAVVGPGMAEERVLTLGTLLGAIAVAVVLVGAVLGWARWVAGHTGPEQLQDGAGAVGSRGAASH